ncbi:alpha/beta fold hydrolase [Gorillibacterium timonense]|uniref:alpha/beta fold hydrolase n=1 Tax=Gorillibacterium timonense TaxID=1689269 RepID=UPI00071D9921|nr:alpha/beta hydrolase [Gorillibacterium timonense]
MEAIIERNNIRIQGEGDRTLIFGHGFGCEQNIWRSMIPYFEKDYRIVLFDYVGSGNSDLAAYNPERYSTLYGYVADLLDILEALEIEKAVFVGHSVSSMIGLLASIRKPEAFQSMVLIGPSPRYINDLPDYYGGFDERDVKELLQMMEMNFVGWASMNAAALMDNPERPVLTEQLKDTFCAEDPAIMKNFAQATFLSDHRRELPEVTVPCLIVQCSVDSIVPLEVAEYLHKQLRNSRLEVISARGHYPNLSQPKETSELIRSYLDDSEAQG